MAGPRSHPRRRPQAPARQLSPADWPDWVLSFPGSYNATDPDRQQAKRDAFHEWQEAKREWFTAHGLAPSWVDIDREYRRRRTA